MGGPSQSDETIERCAQGTGLVNEVESSMPNKAPTLDDPMEIPPSGTEEQHVATDVTMGEEGVGNPKQASAEGKNPSNPSLMQRTPVSYKSMLTGQLEGGSQEEFAEQVKGWLQEEEEVAPALTAEEKQMFEGLPKLNMNDERWMELCRPWKDALILTLLGKEATLNMMKDRIAWILKDRAFELIDLPNNYYVFRSTNKALGHKLLFDGPWLIQGHYLAIQRWSPNFNPYCNKVRKVAIWVRVPTLPMYVYSEVCLMELGNMIGTALKVDINTLAHHQQSDVKVEKGKYARVSVEVDLNKSLQSRFVICRKLYTVEYESLDLICFKCGCYGHKLELCPTNAVAKASPAAPGEATHQDTADVFSQEERDKVKHPLVSVPGVTSEEKYGDWMKAKNTFRPRN